MRLTKWLLVPMVFLLLAYGSSSAIPTNHGTVSTPPSGSSTLQQTIDLVDKKIDEKLNRTDFSGVEISELKAFVHKAIKSQDAEKVVQSTDLILKSTATAIEQYKDHKSECKVQQKFVAAKDRAQSNENCFRSFIEGLCPHWPFCK